MCWCAMSRQSDETGPGARPVRVEEARAVRHDEQPGWALATVQPVLRALHSSTFLLNLSAFCGIGVQVGVVEGSLRGCLGGV